MTIITNRKIDELGRILLPPGILSALNLKAGDSLELCVKNNRIILLPNRNRCALCETTVNLVEINGRYICSGCKEKAELWINVYTEKAP